MRKVLFEIPFGAGKIDLVTLHWGDPAHPMSLYAKTGSTRYDGPQESGRTDHFIRHDIARLYGLSVGHRWIVGWFKFGPTKKVSKRHENPKVQAGA